MNPKLLRITLYTNCEGWRRMDNIFHLIPILWRLKHMCLILLVSVQVIKS